MKLEATKELLKDFKFSNKGGNAPEHVKNLIKELEEVLRLYGVSKSLKVDIQHFDLTDCPYQINTFLHQHKIKKEHIISFSRSDKYLTMVYQAF
jgi:hypothetical protein